MIAPATVLVVDDERGIVELVGRYLRHEGFQVHEAGDGIAAVDLAREVAPDVIVLDIMLPGLDGLEVTRRVRAFSDAYILMLSARTEEVDRIIGLTAGADDYLVKPFSPRELVARVRAMLRRPRTGAASPVENEVVSANGLEIDTAAHEARVGGEPVELTPLEFELLATLASRPGMVFSRAQLIERVWGEFYGDERVVDVHVSNLRRKIEPNPAEPRYVETVRGVGYRLRRPGR
ncbi:MAG TPA: response regulator transcription factor [Thermomicrobiales bacterium]|nr:response regulator transcription factor [Thermomicrobiales bacterium]